jgi:hypothetical protein
VDCASPIADRLVDVEEEPRNQIVNPKFAHQLGQPGRMGEVQKHHDPMLAGRSLESSEKHAQQHRSTDQDEPRQVGRKPIPRQPAKPARPSD